MPAFARPAAATAMPALAGFGSKAPAWLGHPMTAAGGAVALLAVSVVALVSVMGDPHAGAPVVRAAIADKAAAPDAAPSLRPTLGLVPSDGENAAADKGAVARPAGDPLLSQINARPAAPLSGQATITLPKGGSLNGAAQQSTPVAATARAKGQPLAPAPIAGLTQPGPNGPQPMIGKDGRTPFQAYARPFQSNGKPRIAIVVGGLGLNAAYTRGAIERLPPEVTLSFVPYSDGLQTWINLARANGHEVILEAPMEPADYPNNDPGPYTLMANAKPDEMLRRMDWLLGRATGYFAVTNYLGGRFVTSDGAMTLFANTLKAHGLGFIDDGSALRRAQVGIPRASADSVIDEQLSADAIDRQLLTLEARALQTGQSLGAGFAYPVTIDQVIRWSNGLNQRGYQLTPASAVARK